MNPISEIIGDYKELVDLVQQNLKGVGIDIENRVIDHLAFRASSNEEYDHIKDGLVTQSGSLIGEKIIRERRVCIVKLNEALEYGGSIIPCIEVLAPAKGDRTYKRKLEHLEVVIDDQSLQEFALKHPDINFETKNLGNSVNPELILIFPNDANVKFHPDTIEEVIRLESKTTDPQDEIFDVVDENDEIVGEATRGEVHSNRNLIHRVVHIWIINDKGEILLQQRSLTKDKAPGQWDISCGGHIQKGDDPEISAERELQEELGISAECEFISKFLERWTDQSEMVNLYYATHNGPFTFSKEEIEQIKFFSETEALEFIKRDSKASYFSKKEIPLVFEFLKSA